MTTTLASLLRRCIDLQEAGRSTIGCLLVHARGSTPQSAGALMVIDDNAGTHGTIGGGCVEAEVRSRAMELIGPGKSQLMRFQLNHDYGWDDGLLCGGTIELAVAPLPDRAALGRIVDDIENRRAAKLELQVQSEDGPQVYTLKVPPRERLYIAGAGHVGQALARHGVQLDFEVTLFDDRPALLDAATPPGAASVCGDIAASLARAPFDPSSYCVIVTRGHRNDEKVLEAVVDRGAGYLGMIGSRRKVKVIFDDLVDQGVSRAELERVHAPIGLDIGSVTVEEIALSIAAQLVEVRRRQPGAVVEQSQSAAAEMG